MRSLSEYVDDIVSDDRTLNSDIIGFTGTQLNPSVSKCQKMETLHFFKY